MARVCWTRHLEKFFPALAAQGAALSLKADSAAQVVGELDARHPGIRAYIVDERGALRTHVNIFLDGRPLRDRERLSDVVSDDTEVVIMQALSGG